MSPLPHGPYHQLLLCLDPQLPLDAVQGVSHRHGLVAPRLGDLRVRLPAGEQPEGLPLQRGQPLQGLGGHELVLAAEHREDLTCHIVWDSQPVLDHVQVGLKQLLGPRVLLKVSGGPHQRVR